MKTGYIDSCQQRDIVGWAVSGGEPARGLVVAFDGRVVGNTDCSLPRPDVAALGLPLNSGFVFRSPRPISAEVRHVAVCFPDGVPLGNSPSQGHIARVDRFAAGIDPVAPGLELGALGNPFLRRPFYNVSYVDHALKAELLHKYRSHHAGMVDQEAVVETDIVWPPGASLVEAARGRRFRYAVASHVIEHIADPIGWLGALAAAVEPGGRINLAVPEQTRTFDSRRALTTPAELVADHRAGLTKPSFRQVFDQLLGTTPEPGAERCKQLLEMAMQAEKEYVDVHCHVWTHDSFRTCWAVIDALGLLPLELAQSWEALPGTNEFFLSFVSR